MKNSILKIMVTRDSVCAADDIDAPHEKIIHISKESTIHSLVEVLNKKYIPKIKNGKATWSLHLDKALVVWTQEIEPPVFLISSNTKIQYIFNVKLPIKIHLKYWEQKAIETVLDLLFQLLQCRCRGT